MCGCNNGLTAQYDENQALQAQKLREHNAVSRNVIGHGSRDRHRDGIRSSRHGDRQNRRR